MSRLVPDWGRASAKYALIGEAPGKEEQRRLKPFIGSTGRMLFNDWLEPLGLKRWDFYISNVYPFRPEKNHIETIAKEKIEKWTGKLHDRLAELDAPLIVVPVGNYALRACMRRNDVRITDYRGSILKYVDNNGRKVKMIPTLHPASTFYQRSNTELCLRDWARIAEESNSPKLNLRQLTHTIYPSVEDGERFIDYCDHLWEIPLAMDIESNPKERKILMVGFAIHPNVSITFPWQGGYKKIIKRLCENRNPKVMQYGQSDVFYLAAEGVRVRNWTLDLLPMHHMLYPGQDHNLAVQASLDTRIPFWKRDCDSYDDQQKTVRKFAKDWTTFLKYNGKDCCATRELQESHMRKLKERGQLDFYYEHYGELLEPIAGIMQHGVRVDQQAMRRLRRKCKKHLVWLDERMVGKIGYSLVAKTALSNAKIAKYLYEEQGCRVKRKRKTGKVTTDEIALRQTQLRYPEIAKEINWILDYRETQKMASSLKEERVDEDGRMRFSLGFDTATGRLRSSKSPWGTGANSQNPDRRPEIRELFVPDEGCVLLEVDMSQIESRFVNVFTKDPPLLKEARSQPDKFDMHTRNASKIFGVSEKKIREGIAAGIKKFKDMRFMGKKVVHASQRGMMGQNLSEQLLKDGYVRTPAECQRMIDAYMQENEAIPKVYFRSCREIVMRERRMVNSWGREWLVPFERMGDELYRKAYSFLPQSECADLVNQYGLKPLWRLIEKKQMRTRINLHVHDALVMSCPPDEVYRVMRFLERKLTQKRWYSMYYGDVQPGGRPKDAVELGIPVEMKLGTCWAAEYEFKKMPGKERVEEVVKELMGKIEAQKADRMEKERRAA